MMSRRVFPTLLICACALSACKKAEVETYRVPKETAAAQPKSPHAHGTMPPAAAPAAAPGAAAAPAGGGMGSGMGGGSMANTPVATASGPGLTWTAPAHWKSKAGSAMRKATYTVSGEGGEAELAVTAFPGDVGGELANLNRWRGQINLPPIGQAEFESSVQRLERNGLKIVVIDIVSTGTPAARMLGAMVPFGGATWFFKMQGPDVLVAKEKPAFLSLIDTIKAGAPAK